MFKCIVCNTRKKKSWVAHEKKKLLVSPHWLWYRPIVEQWEKSCISISTIKIHCYSSKSVMFLLKKEKLPTDKMRSLWNFTLFYFFYFCYVITLLRFYHFLLKSLLKCPSILLGVCCLVGCWSVCMKHQKDMAVILCRHWRAQNFDLHCLMHCSMHFCNALLNKCDFRSHSFVFDLFIVYLYIRYINSNIHFPLFRCIFNSIK